MFERLPQRSQIDTLAKDGVKLAQRTYKGWAVTLFSLHGLFVEQWVGNDMQVMSTFKKSANAVTVLEPYLDDLDVQELMESEI